MKIKIVPGAPKRKRFFKVLLIMYQTSSTDYALKR